MPRPLYLRESDSVSIALETGCAPGPVLTGAENLALPGFDPGGSDSLYRLRYPGQPIFDLFLMSITNNTATLVQLFIHLLDLEVRLSFEINKKRN